MATPRIQAEIEDITKALKQQAQTPAQPQGESNWDRMAAGLKEAADRSTGWAADRVRDTLGEAVSRFFGLPEHSQQPSDKQPEHEKGIDR